LTKIKILGHVNGDLFYQDLSQNYKELYGLNVRFFIMYDKQALMVYNPFSGKQKKHKEFPMLINKLSDLGYHLTIYQPNELTHFNDLIKKACQQKWDAIFIAGGDGTINRTIQLVAEEEYRPNIGVFPFGTSNEFAKFMGIPLNIFDVVSIIESGCLRSVDIGKFGNRYFTNIAAAGWLTDITYETPPYLKSKIGELAYCLYFFKQFLMKKPLDTISIKVSSQVLSDLSLFIVMKGNSVGPINRLIEEKTSDDEAFHLITYKKTARIRLFCVLLSKMLNLTNDPSIIQHTKIKSADFIIPESLALNLDGELAKVNSTSFNVLPKHLKVFSSRSKK
jgi:diacylglycerol kinase (ATP)